jgi:hypothetical protein
MARTYGNAVLLTGKDRMLGLGKARGTGAARASAKYLAALAIFVGILMTATSVSAQGVWNINDLASAQGNVQIAGAGQNLAGFAWEAQNTEHVFFIGSDSHVHELYHDTAWHHNDLTRLSGDPGTPVGHLAAYVWEKQGTEHVFYVGTGGEAGVAGAIPHIHEIYYEAGKWHAHDLNQAVPDAMLPAYDKASLAAYVFQRQNTQHVVYVGNDLHIHEFYYDNAWHHSDLSKAASKQPEDVLAGGITAFASEYENTEHVFYIGTGVSELWWDGTWHVHSVGQDQHGVEARPAYLVPKLAGYSWESRKSQHVVYIDNSDSHIHEIYLNENPHIWINSDLSSTVGQNKAFLPGLNAKPGAVPGLAGYAFESDGTEHVIYVGVNNDLWELYSNGNAWQVGGRSQDGIPISLIQQFNLGPNSDINTSTHLVGYALERQKSEHIFFVTNKGTICELYHTP